MIAQRLLPAFAVLSVAAAQTASICNQATATINSQADATQYAACKTIKGSVLIGTGAPATLSLDGPEEIDGDLIAKGAANLQTFSSATITTITGLFNFNNLTGLSALTMSELEEVGGISFTTLTALSELTFPKNISKAKTVLITDTFLGSLDGINLANSVDTLDINNNNRLKDFSTEVKNITTSLSIDANGRNLTVSLPNLSAAAGDLVFKSTVKVNIPALKTVAGDLGFFTNYFEDFQAPNLTSVGGALAFVGNSQIENITIPLLTKIAGADQIANNSALVTISFPALQSVGGAIDFSGNFSTPSIPKLNDVKGGFNIQSTAQIDCSGFEAIPKGVIQGTFICKTTADAKSEIDANGTTTAGAASPTKTKNAASINGAGSAVGLSVLGGLLGMLL